MTQSPTKYHLVCHFGKKKFRLNGNTTAPSKAEKDRIIDMNRTYLNTCEVQQGAKILHPNITKFIWTESHSKRRTVTLPKLKPFNPTRVQMDDGTYAQFEGYGNLDPLDD